MLCASPLQDSEREDLRIEFVSIKMNNIEGVNGKVLKVPTAEGMDQVISSAWSDFIAAKTGLPWFLHFLALQIQDSEREVPV